MSNQVWYMGCPGGCKSSAKLIADSIGAEFVCFPRTEEYKIIMYINSQDNKKHIITGCAVGGLLTMGKAKSFGVTLPHQFPSSNNFILGNKSKFGHPLPTFPLQKYINPSFMSFNSDYKFSVVYESWWVGEVQDESIVSSRVSTINDFLGGSQNKIQIINTNVENPRVISKEGYDVLLNKKQPVDLFNYFLDRAEKTGGIIVTNGTMSFIEAIFRCPTAPVWFEFEKRARNNRFFVDYMRSYLFGAGERNFALKENGVRYSGLNNVSQEEILKMNEKVRYLCVLSHIKFMQYICENIPDRKIKDPNSDLGSQTPVFEYHLKLFDRYVKSPWFSQENVDNLVYQLRKSEVVRSSVDKSRAISFAAAQLFSKKHDKKDFSDLDLD